MFHAAGLARGRAVAALIGPSGTGKSTAARILCREDFDYVTDETVAVKPDGFVTPFPKPIAYLPAEGGGKREVGPDELGLRTCNDQLELGGLVLMNREADRLEPQVDPLDLLRGMVALIPHMSALPHLPAPLNALAQIVEACGGVFHVTYSEAHQLGEVVRSALSAKPCSGGVVHHPASEPVRGAGTVRAAYTDAIELEGEVLVLRNSDCLLLSGIGGLIWLAANEPRELDALEQRVVSVTGPHPDSAELVRAAVEELRALGVLQVGPDVS